MKSIVYLAVKEVLALWRVLEETSGSAAPRRSSTRHRKQTEQGGTQSARERAFVAEPLGDPPVFPRAAVFEWRCLVYRLCLYIGGL